MTEDISSALGDTYVMFYTPRWPAHTLSPVCTLDQSISVSNQAMARDGRDLSSWGAGDQDEIARLLRANWIYHNLDREPIRKPILVHRQQQEFIVDCGDTRLMALDLQGRSAMVSVVITDRVENAHLYQAWMPIRRNEDLVQACGFADHAQVFFRAVDGDFAIDWLEIGDVSTSHHLHDVDQRIRMMQNYLDRQPSTFFFDRAWAQSPIDWLAYD